MIKGIFFDVHDTLINKGGASALQDALKSVTQYLIKKGYKVTFDEYLSAWKQNILKHRQDIIQLNEVSFKDWYKGILEELEIKDYPSSMIYEFNEAWMEAFKNTTTVLKNVRQTLETLKGNYILGIISNSLAQNTNIDLKRMNLYGFFECFCISSDVGKRKPHPAIFNKALAEVKLTPKEVIFIGDNIYEDVYGAQQVGIKTILFESINKEDNKDKKMLKQLKIEAVPDLIIKDFSEILTILKTL